MGGAAGVAHPGAPNLRTALGRGALQEGRGGKRPARPWGALLGHPRVLGGSGEGPEEESSSGREREDDERLALSQAWDEAAQIPQG